MKHHANGIKINGTNAVLKHDTNATNEIATLYRSAVAGTAKAINDGFASLNSAWTQSKGTWSISSGQANVDSLTSSQAVLIANSTFDDGYLEAKVTPTGSTPQAGVVFSHDGNNTYYTAMIRDTGFGKILALYYVVNGSLSLAKSETCTFSVDTQYTLKVYRKQQRVYVEKVGDISFTYDATKDLGKGKVGLFANNVNTKFDDFVFQRNDDYSSKAPRWQGNTDFTFVIGGSGYIQTTTGVNGGEVVLEGFSDDDYMVQYDTDLNSGKHSFAFVRYSDANNFYAVDLDGTNVTLYKVKRGEWSSLVSTSAAASGFVSVKVKLSGATIKVWVGGTLKINTTDSTFASGGLAFSGDAAKFKNIKVGYDTNSDDDLDDAGDDLVFDDDYTAASVTLNADHSDGTADAWDKNGNMLDDGTFKYEYDAWNRLTKVKTQHDNLTLATYAYDALGRRIKKVVTNSAPFDGTTYFYYNGRWQMLESRNGSEGLDMQVIYGTQYVDEIVRFERNGYGTMYVFQDANWNVTSTTSFAGDVLDRLQLTPYGEPTFDAVTINGDYDGDGDLDSGDDGNLTTCKNGSQPVTGACRVFDYNNDGDVNATDESRFDSLYPGTSVITRQPARRTSANRFAFAHQGLMLDEETQHYYNRYRWYNTWLKRFPQRDPITFAIRGTRFEGEIGPPQSSPPTTHQTRALFLLLAEFAEGSTDRLDTYGYVDQNPTILVDPEGLCPPSPACTPGPCGTGGCNMYLPWHPAHFAACVAAGNGPWANCVRACLQQCICSYNVCIRWGAGIQAGCHLGCWSGC